MKILFTAFFILLGFAAIAQDTITDKAGNTHQVKILDETTTSIIYKVGNNDPITISKNHLAAYSYAPGTRPEKRNNTIVIETTDDYSTALKRIVGILNDAGYGIQNVDKELGLITTTPKSHKGGNSMLNMQVREENVTRIIIRGLLDGLDMTVYGVTIDGKATIEYRGMKGSPLMIAWDDMNKLALSYPEAKVTYTTK